MDKKFTRDLYEEENIFVSYTTSRNVAGSIADVIGFFSQPNPSICTMALGSTQPLTETSTRNLPGGKGQPVHKADNLTTITLMIT
jgi:hypothetical protein